MFLKERGRFYFNFFSLITAQQLIRRTELPLLFMPCYKLIAFVRQLVAWWQFAYNGSRLCAGGASKHESFNPPLMFN